jgi:TetR/AcrR family transcriptional repressor of nem operon
MSVFKRRMTELVEILAPAMRGTPQEQQQHAWTAVATIVGAVTVARCPPGTKPRLSSTPLSPPSPG